MRRSRFLPRIIPWRGTWRRCSRPCSGTEDLQVGELTMHTKLYQGRAWVCERRIFFESRGGTTWGLCLGGLPDVAQLSFLRLARRPRCRCQSRAVCREDGPLALVGHTPSEGTSLNPVASGVPRARRADTDFDILDSERSRRVNLHACASVVAAIVLHPFHPRALDL